jgi:hypothetical protein
MASADEIAEMATRGEDVSSHFTNEFAVVRPVLDVNVEPTAITETGQSDLKDKKRLLAADKRR